MIEILTFRLRPDADVDAFLEVDGRVQTEVAYHSAGLLRRTTGRNGDSWLVLQVWNAEVAADVGRRAFGASEQGQAFMAFVDADSVSIERFEGLD